MGTCRLWSGRLFPGGCLRQRRDRIRFGRVPSGMPSVGRPCAIVYEIAPDGHTLDESTAIHR